MSDNYTQPPLFILNEETSLHWEAYGVPPEVLMFYAPLGLEVGRQQQHLAAIKSLELNPSSQRVILTEGTDQTPPTQISTSVHHAEYSQLIFTPLDIYYVGRLELYDYFEIAIFPEPKKGAIKYLRTNLGNNKIFPVENLVRTHLGIYVKPYDDSRHPDLPGYMIQVFCSYYDYNQIDLEILRKTLLSTLSYLTSVRNRWVCDSNVMLSFFKEHNIRSSIIPEERIVSPTIYLYITIDKKNISLETPLLTQNPNKIVDDFINLLRQPLQY